ncbi:hypothetical protein PHYBOEH_007827 [Phytophthora boehmeriae]|uniref:Uncharacterized protein n=1 Tax=Phytophthora boehmeriae TaxID=109152 RepID=A0A8T1X642_9STRA|nr:hypothetical protein PHYBOEH_007827 [Phytophthora boehmeriae]
MSFVSTFSNATMLDDEEEEDAQQLERNEPQEPEHEGIGGGEQRESQAELIALQEQVEGLHRSLAAATFQLNSIHSRRTSRRAQPQADPVIARHQATYGRLVEELHEIMGLPRPGREY